MIPGSANPLLLASAAQAGGYAIERSLRFNSADSAYLSRTPASAGNRKTWTWAGWVKRTNLGGALYQVFIARSTDTTRTGFGIYQDNLYVFFNDTANWRGQGVASLRDTAAWYHVVMTVDTTQATASNRIRLWINNQLQTISTVSGAMPPQNTDGGVNNTIGHAIGVDGNNTGYPLDGYLADVHFIDGQALDPTSFGFFDANGIWQPKAYTGTYGTNGFHLTFSNNSSAASLGEDTSGNENTWTVNNFSLGVGNIFVTSYSGVTYLYFNNTTQTVNTDNLTTLVRSSVFQNRVVNNDRFDLSGSVGSFVTISYSGLTGITGIVIRLQRSLSINVDFSVSGVISGSGTATTNSTEFIFNTTDTSGTFTIETTNSSNGLLVQDISYIGASVGTNTADNDSLVDVPTNGTETDTGLGGEVRGSYCVLNPLDTTFILSNGNLDNGINGSGQARGTIALPAGSKIYYEAVLNAPANSNYFQLGIVARDVSKTTQLLTANAYSIEQNQNQSTILRLNGSSLGSFSASLSGTVFQVAIDLIDGKLWLGRDNTWYDSAGGTTGNPSIGTNPTASILTTTQWFPAVYLYASASAGAYSVNFGQRPFAYTAPSGFKALCTTNLPAPVVTKPSQYMEVKLYTGNGSTQTISGLEFSPDLVWLKNRAQADNHKLLDTVRGATEELESNTTDGEVTNADGLTAFNSDGFDLGADVEYNTSTEAYVAWTWDAGSSTVTNADGSITSQVRANPSAGFSIVKWTGSGGTGSVGHGLNVTPAIIIAKFYSGSAGIGTTNWWVAHVGLNNFTGDALRLNETFGPITNNSYPWNNTINSSVFGVTENINASTNAISRDYIAYCFAPVESYSAFGSYTGNGSTDGPFVFTNMRPRWILIKRTDTASNWTIIDTAREGYNVDNDPIYPNLNNAEGTTDLADILSNGFKLRSTDASVNASSGTYVYACFGESPFKYARAR